MEANYIFRKHPIYVRALRQINNSGAAFM